MKMIRHYGNDNGQVCCGVHAGRYLSNAIAQFPTRVEWDTPLGVWELLTDEEVNYLAGIISPVCDSCRMGV